jgi:hypothetical protein
VTLKMRAADYLVILATFMGLGLALYVYFKVPLPNLIIPFQIPPIQIPRLF